MPASAAAAFGLVGDQHHGLALLADAVGELPVDGGDAGAGIDHEEDQIGIVHGAFGLGAHARFERILARLIEARRVEHPEFEIADAAFALAAVAGDPGLVIDKRDLAPHQAVKKRGLANVGAAKNGDGGGH